MGIFKKADRFKSLVSVIVWFLRTHNTVTESVSLRT
nr:MAG TPA: hypothetical protein [Caudoviricetes sp.]